MRSMLSFHEYQDSDLPTLTALMNQWASEIHYTGDWIQNNIKRILAQSDNMIFLAKDGSGTVLGYTEIGPAYFLGFEPYFEILEILVAAKHRSGGVGTFMLAEIEKIALREGFSAVL